MKLVSFLATAFLAFHIQGIIAQETAPLPSSCSEVPASASYPATSKLPDPYLEADRTRLTTKEQWECKRAEIREQLQILDIACSEGGKSISFSVTVKAPSGSAHDNVDVLPYDHHMLMGLVAPRALLVIENSGIDYLGPPSTYGCSKAAKEIFTSLGLEGNMGASQVSHGSSHFQMPASQNPDVAAFYDKFFFNNTADTNFLKTDETFKFDLGRWADWTLLVLTREGQGVGCCLVPVSVNLV